MFSTQQRLCVKIQIQMVVELIEVLQRLML